MIKMDELFPWDLLPDSMKTEETKAISTAVGNGMHRMLRLVPRTSVHAAIDSLPEIILDLLAIEYKTQYYQQNLPIEVKRTLIKSTIPWYAKAGTPSVLEEYLETIFNGGEAEEWFSYGGQPYFFRVYIFADVEIEITLEKNAEVREGIFRYKNVRSWLEAIIYQFLWEAECMVETSSRLTLRSEFYPRANIEPLLLDGTWYLDGSQLLSGWKDADIDLYPTRLKLTSEVQCAVQERTGLTVEKDLWYLDGTYGLDGEKLLDADILLYEL